MNFYPEEIKSLPIYPHLEELCTVLKESKSHFMVLTAQTGAGKSTAVPLALLKNFSGGILMLEPRRLAVLNIANRVSSLLDEEAGKTCGYVMRMEKRISDATRFTVLTEAVLTRRLQKDPALEGISVVVIDEFHERSVHADLALAFLKEAMMLRDDLYVIVMSATIETKRLSGYLGTDSVTDSATENGKGTLLPCPVFSVEGRTFPVEIEYDEKSSVSQAVFNELYKKPDELGINKGSILVFLPGLREIRKIKEELELGGALDCADILLLHSSVPFAEQKKVLSVPKAVPKSVSKSNTRRRVILSSAIAETSVTVPDVTVVIDSGYMRFSSFNRTAGMPALVTQRESLFNAAQRTGRAGRVQCGRCVRLWNKDDVLALANPPEILRTDLTSLVLECAEWGAMLPESLSWLDEPPINSWQTAKSLLKDLNCMDENSITALGKAALLMGCHPRLACVALSGAVFGNIDLSTELASKYDKSVSGNLELVKKSALELKKRVQKAVEIYSFSSCFPQKFSDFSTACALLCGFPDRIALLEDDATGLYHFPSGRMALLPKETHRPYPKFIIAPEADAGEKTGRIYSFEALPEKIAEEYLADKAKVYTLVEFEHGGQRLRKREYTSYGKIVLKERALNLEPGDYTEAVINQVKKEGIEWLPVGKAAKNLLLRVQFYLENLKDSDKSLSDGDSLHQKFNSLAENTDEWLRPFLGGVEKSVPEQKVYDALYWYLDGDKVNASVPQEIRLANGRRLKIQYEAQNGKIIPLAEIIIQQIFGCFETPRVMGLPVLLKLLSPARRPLQITSDLANFWKETWPQICSEMKGRYPKHNWDYRVISD
ncbi:MAG: ATP-dependent helicase HrpB [Treponema sp.]|nr:ATP-dependent helicase HrpB [Treponema sp.]